MEGPFWKGIHTTVHFPEGPSGKELDQIDPCVKSIATNLLRRVPGIPNKTIFILQSGKTEVIICIDALS